MVRAMPAGREEFEPAGREEFEPAVWGGLQPAVWERSVGSARTEPPRRGWICTRIAASEMMGSYGP